MKDPYEVLGVGRNATDDEIKAAYRNLARKYHPDNFSDETAASMANEKMQEINEAYDTIINGRKGRDSSSYNGSNNYADVRNMINMGRIDDAQQILDGVPIGSRDAEWYFLNGSLLYKKGWFDQAYTSFSRACQMDPNNMEYREAFNRINSTRRGAGYRGMGQNPVGGECSACDVCSSLICADCCCECMGGDLIPCC